MKKIIASAAAALLLSAAMISPTVNAAEESCITVTFGDSIATGYGLDGYFEAPAELPEDCFVNLWAKEKGLTLGSDCFNFAVNGYTSKQIFDSICAAKTDTISSADLILISAGGNDIMKTYEKSMTESLHEHTELIGEFFGTLDLTNDAKTENSFFSTLLDATKNKAVEKLAAYCTDEKYQKEYDNIPGNYQNNLKKMISYIRNLNKNAEIIILVPYDPMPGFEVDNELTRSVGESMEKLTTAAAELMLDKEYNDKLHITSLVPHFKGREKELINVSKVDIHPNKEGHKVIFQLIKDTMTNLPAEELSAAVSELTSEQNSEQQSSAVVTNIPASKVNNVMPDYVLYILVPAACLCVVAIIIFFIIKQVKAKKPGKK